MKSFSIDGSTCITDSSSAAWRSILRSDSRTSRDNWTRAVTSTTVTMAKRIRSPSQTRSKAKVRYFCEKRPSRSSSEVSISRSGLVFGTMLSLFVGSNRILRNRPVSS